MTYTYALAVNVCYGVCRRLACNSYVAPINTRPLQFSRLSLSVSQFRCLVLCISCTMSMSKNDSIVSEELCTLLDRVQVITDREWNRLASTNCGANDPAMAIRLLSASNSHPAFPIFCLILATLPSLANGKPPATLHASSVCVTDSIAGYC